VVTLVGICDNPHYTSCTDPGKNFSGNMKSVFVLVEEGHEVGRKWVK